MSDPLTQRPDRRRYTQDIQKLASLAQPGKQPRDKAPAMLRLNSIKILPSLFQPRDSLIYRGASIDHVAEMKAYLERSTGRSKILDPVIVMSFGSQWFLIDGHHRMAAYRDANMSRTFIPVAVCASKAAGKQRVTEAIAASIRLNAKDKLPMKQDDKRNAAWRLVVSGGLSKKQIMEAAGVAEGTVANMRRVCKVLQDHPAHRGSLEGMRWRFANMAALRIQAGDLELDEIEARAARIEWQAVIMVKRLRKYFGLKLTQDFEVTFRALEMYDDYLLPMLRDHSLRKAQIDPDSVV